MSNFDKLIKLIEAQQKGKENTDVFMVGEQLKDIGSESEHNAEILLQDLQIKTMDLVAGAAKLKDYADKNHKGAKCFCISPKVADGILREFYGLEKPEEVERKPAAEAVQESEFIDLEDFL